MKCLSRLEKTLCDRNSSQLLAGMAVRCGRKCLVVCFLMRYQMRLFRYPRIHSPFRTSCQQPRLRKPSSGCIETGFPRSRGFSPTSQVRLPFPSAFSSTGCSCASRVFLVSHMGYVQELSRFVFSAEMNFVKHFRLFSQL